MTDDDTTGKAIEDAIEAQLTGITATVDVSGNSSKGTNGDGKIAVGADAVTDAVYDVTLSIGGKVSNEVSVTSVTIGHGAAPSNP